MRFEQTTRQQQRIECIRGWIEIDGQETGAMAKKKRGIPRHFSHAFLHFSRFETLRAYLNPLDFPLCVQDPHVLKIRQPSSFGLSVGVTYIKTRRRPFSADVTSESHDVPPFNRIV